MKKILSTALVSLCIIALAADQAIAKKTFFRYKGKPAHGDLILGIVVSAETKENAQHGKKAAGLMKRHDNKKLLNDAKHIIQRNFKELVIMETVTEAPLKGVHLVAELDVLTERFEKEIKGVTKNHWRVVLGTTYLEPSGKLIEDIRCEREFKDNPVVAAVKINSAFKKCLKEYEKDMRASEKLKGYTPSQEVAQLVLGGAAPKKKKIIRHSSVDKPKYRKRKDPNSFAIIMGVEKYPDLPTADFAERDANSMRKHLKAMGVPDRNIVLLVGERASKAGLAKNLEMWLPKVVNEESTVYFFYSGHGAPDISSKQSYLVPIDGDPKYLETTGYPVGRLYNKLAQLKAKRIIVALDACFSGAGGRSVIPKGTRPLVLNSKAKPIEGRMIVFSASGADEITGTLESEGHGLFTYHFLKGLNGAAKKMGKVTVNGLFEYLKPNVADDAKKENRDQTPTLRGLKDEDWVLR
jgi:hypothetical protein